MEPPLINDATFSSANPSLSEIWPSQFPSSNKRPSSLLLHNHSPNSNKHVKLSPPPSETHQNAALQPPQPDATSVAAAHKSPLQTPKPKLDYIHVRARRGQATDSHSLAERVIHVIYLFLILWFINSSTFTSVLFATGSKGKDKREDENSSRFSPWLQQGN